MRIAIVHNYVENTSSPDEQDVLVQVEVVTAALKEIGHEPLALSCTLNLSELCMRLQEIKPDIVFNLVESLDGQDRLIHLFPSVLDAMGLGYTGSSAESIFLTTQKVLAKERMVWANLPTPEWIEPYPQSIPLLQSPKLTCDSSERCWIIKSLWDHGSLGLDEDSLVYDKNAAFVQEILKNRVFQSGRSYFAEQYIEGREFNLSLLEASDGPQVLPLAEIIFEGYEQGKPRIVGYRAKWKENSYEYHHTPRRFDFPPTDESLLIRLKEMAIRCWQVFGLKGYARVDFRIDEKGQPFILEVNINPCLSPDAGFVAATEHAGLTFIEIVERILRGALRNQVQP